MASCTAIRAACTNVTSAELAASACGHASSSVAHATQMSLTSSFRGVSHAQKVSKKFGVSESSARWTSWFKFGKNGLDAEGAGIYGSQGRDDFDRDDVEQYFNYMGMLAAEGSYDKMEALLETGIHPVDILLLLAASEGDRPKIQELLRAGANATVKDGEGRTAVDRAVDDEIRSLIQEGAEALI